MYEEQKLTEFPIGYLIEAPDGVLEFVCYGCVQQLLLGPGYFTQVFRINIGIYSQECDNCGRLVVDGVKTAKDREMPLCLFGRTA